MFFFKSVISWRSWLWGMTVPGIRMWCSDPLVCGGATARTDSMTLKQVPFPLQHTDPKYTWTSLGRPFLWRRYRSQDARCKSQQTKHWIVRGSSEHWIRFFYSCERLWFHFMRRQGHGAAWLLWPHWQVPRSIQISPTLQLWVAKGSSSAVLRSGECVVVEITREH